MHAFRRKFYIIVISCFIGIFCVTNAKAQIVINEVAGVNVGNVQDEDGQLNTWLELYNSGNSAVDLKNYQLSDRYGKAFKWTFPTYILGAGKRLMVFTSGKDRRLFIDRWETAIWFNNYWKYIAPKSAISSTWIQPGFNDVNWTSGKGGIGFGDGDDSTTIATNISLFIRQKFDVPDTGKIVRMLLSMDYDDGFIAYLNGIEIARSNMNGNAWNDSATATHEALIYQGYAPETFDIPDSVFRNLLMPTGNVLAIQVHNLVPNSSDLSAIPNLSLAVADTGTWYAKRNLSWIPSINKTYLHTNFKLGRNEGIYINDYNGNFIDSTNTGYLDSGLVVARIPDGQSWCITPTATPDSTNNGQKCFKGYATPPAFSLKAGFYKITQYLKLTTANKNFEIRYTENGNTPNANSKKYTPNIIIDKSKVIRARCFDTTGQYLPGKVFTNTYFINENINLPVIAISTDSSNLWDWDSGIYAMGRNAAAGFPHHGANFWYDWERPCHVEYFKPSKIGTQLFEVDAGLKIHGNYSRGWAQKSFRIETRKGYDSSIINFPLWDIRQYKTVKNFNIRNAGIDWLAGHMRDDVMQRMAYATHNDMMASTPCVAFVNGEYFGVFQIREREDQDYLANIHGTDPNNVDILKWSNTVLEGDGNEWSKLYNFIAGNDLSNNTNYDSATKMIDIENYCDYMIAETYYVNNDWLGDWTNNIKFWRPKKPDGKWRYVLWDTDVGMSFWSGPSQDKLYNLRYPASPQIHSVMFDTMITNTKFKNYFVNRYADLINTIYLPAEFKKVMKLFVDTMDNEMLREYMRWSTQTTLATWNANLQNMYNFIDARPTYARKYIQSNFNLINQDTLTLVVSPANAGRIKISTIIPTKYPWKGVYFNGVPVTVTAIANPGYTFNYFTIGSTKDSNQSITQNYTKDTVIKAFFKGSPQALKLVVSEINYNSPKKPDAGSWIELHNYSNVKIDISDWRFHSHGDYYNYKFPTGTTIGANGYLVLCEDTDKFNKVYPNISDKIGNIGFSLDNFGDSIYLFDNIGKNVVRFGFSDTTGWPQLADGLGHTMEHKYDSAVYTYDTWFNGCLGGSPGKAFAPCNEPIVISEINYKSSNNADAGDWIELYNSTSAAINISKWHFKDEQDTDDYVIPNGTILSAKGYLVLVSDTTKFKDEYNNVSNFIGSFGFGLKSEGEILRLYDSVGNLKFNMLYGRHQPEWPYKPNGMGYTLEIEDTVLDYSSGDSWTTGCVMGSPGTDRVTCNYSLTVSEINYNMEASLSKGDYLELYNYGKNDLYIGDWKLYTKNGVYTFPQTAKIKNKDRLLVTNSDSNFTAWNHIAFGNFKMDNYWDSITLYDNNSNFVLATNYDSSSAYTSLANGIGFTLELVSKNSPLNLGSSWVAGCLGGSPGEAYSPCKAKVLISEINYESANELNVGDWIELYNPNTTSINLNGWNLQTKSAKIQFTSTIINPNERIVFVSDTVKFIKYFGNKSNMRLANYFSLGNTSDEISLSDSNKILKLYLKYNNANPWDNLAAGKGYTLELDKNVLTQNDILLPKSWKHSCLLGSPGDSTSLCNSDISVSEICLRADTLFNSGNWIELHNFGSQPLNLFGYKISNTSQSFVFANNTILDAGNRIVLASDSLKFYNAYHISANSSTLDSLPLAGNLTITNIDNKTIYNTSYQSNNQYTKGYGYTLESLSDTGISASNWFRGCPNGSPNNIYTNCKKINPIISELNTILDASFDDGKWIEIWNKDTVLTLDISSWSIGSNDLSNRFIFPSNTTLKPNARLVLTKDDVKFKTVHPLTNTILLYANLDIDTTGVLRIWDANKKPQFVLFYNNIYQNPGYTLELTMPDTNLEGLSSQAAWKEGCYTGSPATNYMPCSSPILVSEINYNSSPNLDAGDWFELHNTSLNASDLNGWSVLNEANQTIKLNNNLLADSFHLLVSNDFKFVTQHANVYNKTVSSFSLNTSDKLRFYDTEGRLRFIQYWSSKIPWNDSADGLGYTLELMINAIDPSQATQWVIGCTGGSPGTTQVPCINTSLNNIYTTNSFKVYPNPAKEYIIIETANPISNKYILLDATGRILVQGNCNQGMCKIELANYAKGIYLLQINNEVVRVVKE
ncbi:MAG: lamin tail domain-containing protein [Bacteroidota bacterium]|nr:lamin tail domain-containing protein [Bacteroidota bacterium]